MDRTGEERFEKESKWFYINWAADSYTNTPYASVSALSVALDTLVKCNISTDSAPVIIMAFDTIGIN